MERYYSLNIERFLADSKEWEAEIRKLQKELDDIGGLSGLGNSEIRSTAISRPTERDGLKREAKSREIARIVRYREIFDRAMKSLEEGDRRLIEGFYLSPGRKSDFVNAYAREKSCDVRTVYRFKRIALDNLKMEVEALSAQ